jgi:hypothetical protein
LRRLPDRRYEIDLLRIIAAFSVVLYHYTFSGHFGGHSPPVVGMGLLASTIHAAVERPVAPMRKRGLRQIRDRRTRTVPSQMMPRPPAMNSGHE